MEDLFASFWHTHPIGEAKREALATRARVGADIPKRLIANIGAALRHVKTAAEHFKKLDRWGCLLGYISDRIPPVIGPPTLPPTLQMTG